MKYAKQIKDIMETKGGIITSKDLKDNNIPTIYLTRLTERGDLIRADRGIYFDPNGDYDEYYFFHKRYPKAIFSYVSALYLRQFTDIIPFDMEVTLYKGYNAHRMDNSIRIHYVTQNIHGLGVTEVKTKYGNKVKAYDLERTICDFIKNRSEIEIELFSKTINRYVREKDKNMNKLYEYSKEMKIYDKVRDIIEVIYE